MFEVYRKALREVAKLFPEAKPFLSDKALKVIGGFDAILQEYYSAVYLAVKEYLSSSRYTTAFRNRMAISMSESFTDAVYLGYRESGGTLPLDAETSDWLNRRIGEERTHIDSLFERLKQERPSMTPEKIEGEANSRAQGYSNTLDAMYQEARMRGSKNKTLVFTGRPGKDSCPECKKLEGKRHRISWIVANDAVPRPGNEYFSCNGYNCFHYWMDPVTGEAYTF